MDALKSQVEMLPIYMLLLPCLSQESCQPIPSPMEIPGSPEKSKAPHPPHKSLLLAKCSSRKPSILPFPAPATDVGHMLQGKNLCLLSELSSSSFFSLFVIMPLTSLLNFSEILMAHLLL